MTALPTIGRNYQRVLLWDLPVLAVLMRSTRDQAVTIVGMSELTRILDSMQCGNSEAAEKLLPLVYDELRRLAAAKMASEKAGHTLQATALVHEAWLKVAGDAQPQWENRRHFFAAAAETMRRILVDSARRKLRIKRGGDRQRVELDDADISTTAAPDELLRIHESLDQLAEDDETAAAIVKLCYFRRP